MTWGLVAVAGATLVTGAMGSSAAGKAADTQAEATRIGVEEQRRQFDITQENLAPFQEAGVSALAQQQAMLGLGGQPAQTEALEAFANTPGQQFLRQQQERALLRNAAAIGGLGGGNIRTALQQQAAGRAATQLGTYQNQLAGLSGTGQTAATNIGQFGAGTAANIANLQGQAGAARASGILGQQQAWSDTIQSLSGLAAEKFG
jgi:hypothetical protein